MPASLAATPNPLSGRRFWLLALAACLSLGMTLYVIRILIPYQVADARLHDRPRGNLSDLYPRWLGARELWRNGRNPYGEDVTRDIQTGYYGRALDFRRPQDPKDQQGFAYPAYVTFLLVPTLYLPFESVRIGFTWFLLILTCASVLLWLRALQWKPGWPITLSMLLLTVGSFAGLQGIKLQQLSLVVAALVAATAALLVSGQLFAAGVTLAIATIKPQLVALLAAYLVFWALREWRTRRSFLLGFFLTLLALCIGAQWLLPGWIGDFWHAMQRYQQYTGGHSRLDVLLGPFVGRLVSVVLVGALAFIVFGFGNVPANHPRFVLVFSTVLATTLLVMPNFAPYNELLLLPSVLLIARSANSNHAKEFRAVACAAGVFLSWGWIAASGLTLASLFLPAEVIQSRWAMPLWTEFAIAPSVLLVMAFLLLEACKGQGLVPAQNAEVVANS